MKTKHILTAMVLPTLLAACTADEIVENNNDLVAKGRAQVEAVTFAAEGVSSRLTYNDGILGWDWESTDKFLLLTADNGDMPATGDDVLPGEYFTVGTPGTGYEYTKGEDGLYTTSASVMGEGLYWGYAPSFQKLGRGNVKFTLATSQDAEYYKSEAAQALFTPLYEVSAVNYNNKLPLDMINLYSTLVLPLKNSTREDITLNQIVLTADGDKEFVVEGYIDVTKMGSFVMAYDGEKWAPAKNFDPETDEDDLYEYDFAKGKNEMLSDYMRKTNLIDGTKDDCKTSKSIVLELDEFVLEAGATETFYMLVPAIEDVTCNITIIAEEGIVKIDNTSKSNALKKTNIYHNGIKYAFGGTTSAKAFDITAGKFEDLEGAYYVTGYDEMMDLINSVNGTFLAYNIGDWAVDADMALAIEKSDAYVVFMNPISVEGEAIASRAADEEDGLELTKVAFYGKVTVLKNTKVTFASEGGEYDGDEDDEFENETNIADFIADATVNNLVIEEGADVTLASGTFKAVENEGTLTIVKGTGLDVTEAVVTTEGVLNLKDTDVEEVKLNAGDLNYIASNTTNTAKAYSADFGKVTLPAATALEADINIEVGVNVVLSMATANNTTLNATPVGLDDDDEPVYFTNFTNKGTINTDDGYLNVSGDLQNNAGAKIVGVYNVIINNTATNNGELTPNSINIEENAVVYNNATLENVTVTGQEMYSNVTNDGEIVTGVDSYTTVTKGNGRINNTAEGRVYNEVTGEDYQTVFYQFAGDVEELEDINFDRLGMAINTLQINGTLNLDEPFSKENKLGNITTLELASGAKINVDDKIGVTFKEIKVLDGVSVEFKGYSSVDTYIDMYYDAANSEGEVSVEFGKGSKLIATNVGLGKMTTGNNATVKFKGYTSLAADKVATDTYQYLAAASKVVNTQSLIVAEVAEYSKDKADFNAVSNKIYWEGALATSGN